MTNAPTTLTIKNRIIKEVTIFTLCCAIDQNGLGKKIPSDYKIQTNLSNRLYRVYQHTIIPNTYNAPQNYDYIIVKGNIYQVNYVNGNPINLRRRFDY